LPTFNDGRFAIYRAQFTPRIGIQKSGGQLHLRAVTGNAEVWLDGTPAGLGGPVTVELTGSNISAIISKIL
jgi:hypothetical protein